MNSELKILKLKMTVGILVILLSFGGVKIVPDLMEENIILKNQSIFDKNFKPIGYNELTDQYGNDYTEPIFSEDDQAIIDKRNDLLSSTDNVKIFSAILSSIAFLYTAGITEQYIKKRKLISTLKIEK